MARHIGIDIGSTHVRALLLSTGYKRVAIEAINEVAIDSAESLEQAVRACTSAMLLHSDGVATAVDGDSTFVHRMKLPLTARKQIDAILPFELESQMPVDISELVYDYRVLRSGPGREWIDVIAALARTEQVKERIELVKRATGREPERVGCGSLVLANLVLLAPELRGKSPIALVDLGSRRTEVTVLSDGEPIFVRTLSRGVAGLPATANALVAELRQTFLAFLSSTDLAVDSVVLLGGGSGASGADQYLSIADVSARGGFGRRAVAAALREGAGVGGRPLEQGRGSESAQRAARLSARLWFLERARAALGWAVRCDLGQLLVRELGRFARAVSRARGAEPSTRRAKPAGAR
jgi:general secretion pathway protein L